MLLLIVVLALLLPQTPTVSTSEPPELDVLVRADWLARELAEDDIVVLHVGRDHDEYLEGHVPGAHFLLFEEIVVHKDGLLNVLPDPSHLETVFGSVGVSNDTRVVIYGDHLPAARAFMTLDVLGHPAVAVLDGGLREWRDRGYPVAKEASAPTTGQFKARLREGRFATADMIAGRLDDQQLVLVDARPAAEYSGADPGTDISRPGHIPGAVNLFWRDGLSEFDRFIPIDELETRWRQAGVSAGRDLVVYCRTGMQASHAYLTARALGLEPMIYDPSFQEWSNLTEYPVATGAN